jgi:type II secretory pathway component PulF
MTAFRYRALQGSGAGVDGVIEAEDRRAALQALAARGLFPSLLEPTGGAATTGTDLTGAAVAPAKGFRFGAGVGRKDVTSFSREMASLIAAGIPIPQALEGIADEEPNAAMKAVIARIAADVKTGASLSAAMARHPRLFGNLYTSMMRVGEEAGALPRVMTDLADLLEHDDEVRSEVRAAIAYPLFVLGFGIVTVVVLLTVVLPNLFSMLQEMLDVLPLPTLILLKISGLFSKGWYWMLAAAAGMFFGVQAWLRTPAGALRFDRIKLKLPVLGGLVMASALSRFARTLGILVKSGVSLLPALKIVEATVGNLVIVTGPPKLLHVI